MKGTDLSMQLRSANEAERYQAVQALIEQKAIAELVPALSDSSWRVRREAVRGLAHHPNPSQVIVTLLKTLRENHQDIGALNSIMSIMAASNVDVVVPLVESLNSDDEDLRIYAALILGHQRNLQAVPALLNALDDPDANVRFHAIEALGRLRAKDAVERLGKVLESGDFFLIYPALEALARIGDSQAASKIVPLLKDSLVCSAAVNALGEIGMAEVVPSLVALLDDSHAPVYEIAAALTAVYNRYESQFGEGEHVADLVNEAISDTGIVRLLDAIPNAPEAHLPHLVRVAGWLNKKPVARVLVQILGQPKARPEVVESLVCYGRHITPQLLDYLEDPDVDTRLAVIQALGRIGDKTAVPALLTQLDKEYEVIIATANALAQIGDKSAFEPLLTLLGHPLASVRQAAISALNSLGHLAMPTHAARMLKDKNPRIRESAARIAGYFGFDECVEGLFAACKDKDLSVRQAAVEGIVFLEDDRVVPALAHALRHDEVPVRQVAVRALAFVEPRDAWPLLLEALDDEASWVRYFAARVIGEVGFVEAWKPLANLAMNDPAYQVRVAAIEALGSLGGATAVTVLAPLVDADEPDLARAAITALGEVAHPNALLPLLEAMRKSQPDLRKQAVKSLAHRGGPGTAGALQWAAATDEDKDVVQTAIHSLAELGTPEAVAALVALTADPDKQKMCISVLASLDESLIDYVARGLFHEKKIVRLAVVDVLARMKHPYATEQLKLALEDADSAVRIAAESALAIIGSQGSLPTS